MGFVLRFERSEAFIGINYCFKAPRKGEVESPILYYTDIFMIRES
jgi:hypothetical protein